MYCKCLSYIVFPVVPGELPGHERAGVPLVPLHESLLAEVEVFPGAEDLLGAGVEVVPVVLVTVVIVVLLGEPVSPASSGLAHVVLHRVLPLQPAHVVHHLAVKVGIVRTLNDFRFSS